MNLLNSIICDFFGERVVGVDFFIVLFMLLCISFVEILVEDVLEGFRRNKVSM